MKKYLIRTKIEGAFIAASKARKDAEVIASQMGYEPVFFSGERTANQSLSGIISLAVIGMRNWITLIRQAEKGSLILLQYPHYPLKSAYLLRWIFPLAKKIKGLRMIALIHDLDSLRGLHGNGAIYSDRKVLPLFDGIICHNGKMKEYLIGQGISPGKMVSLDLFDYLTQAENTHPRREDGIAIAGNLSPEKSRYVSNLIHQLGGTIPIHLYGEGLKKDHLPKEVYLHGAFPPEELPGKLRGGFGLIWDGQEIRSCEGRSGTYLRVNNPHKYSLYLAVGMPVIAWDQAAIAEHVRKNEVGITTDSLETLPDLLEDLSEEQYESMCLKVERMKKSVREGAFLMQALKKAEAIVQNSTYGSE